MKNILIFFALCILDFALTESIENSLVVSSTDLSKDEYKFSNNSSWYPIIYEMEITANISNRFAKTVVTSKVKNVKKIAKETTFSVVLPQKAFISEFVMEIGGKSYKAYVKEKEEAKQIYNTAVATGQTAGHVSISARNSNRFTISVNVEPESKATFLLTYEELLQRKNDQYELVVNIHPGQIVKYLTVNVHINESRPLKFVRTPSLRSGNEINERGGNLDPSSEIQILNSTAIIKFSPDSEKQKQFARALKEEQTEGFSGQFIVQYDVHRDPHGGEVLLQDGYFVHFFAPIDLEPLPKHVVFVLDTSGSMEGRKITQLKNAMHSILDEIKLGDKVSLIEFNSRIKVWNINSEKSTIMNFNYAENGETAFDTLSRQNLSSTSATKETIIKAKHIIQELQADGLTDIIGGLETALHLVKMMQKSNTTYNTYQPIVIFLTDGEPTIGIYSTHEIIRIVTNLNSDINVPIFSLSFGDGADKFFLRKLALKNFGFSRHIYEASDASLQLQDFYKDISSPLLTKIKFTYSSEVKDVTKTSFPIYFKGSEFVVTGRYEESDLPFEAPVSCWAWQGQTILKPTIETPVTSLERLWAYLTVKQILELRDIAEDKTELTKKALDLSLKYSFVTDVTSLVVVKPNDTNAVDTEEADKAGRIRHIPNKKTAYIPNMKTSDFTDGISMDAHSYSSQAHFVPHLFLTFFILLKCFFVIC